MFCPNCSTQLVPAEVSSCAKCGALFGAGSAWRPVATPLISGDQKPIGFARSAFSLLLLFLAVIFLGLALVLKGTAVGGVLPSILSVICGVSGGMVIMAKGRSARKGATIAGAVILIVLMWIVGTVVGGFPP
jgi:hypothetical protein